MARKSTSEFTCPRCFNVSKGSDGCDSCGEKIVLKSGIPSFTDIDKNDPYEEKLSSLANVEIQGFDHSLQQIRDDYMDGSVIDRFFKTRTLCWRVLVSNHLFGRGLVLGNHEEKTAIFLSEILDETFSVDTSITRLRAQTAVAKATGTNINPVHSGVDTLPFPSNSFDVIVIQCRASDVRQYLSCSQGFLKEDGSVILLVDGWTRELGATEPLGLGDTPDGSIERLRSAVRGHSFGISRIVDVTGLNITEQYALLSTNRHENERVFDIQSQVALDWLLHGSKKTASTTPLLTTRYLSQIARKVRILEQCYPRQLFVCEKNKEYDRIGDFRNSILVAGKNRSTVLNFSNDQIENVRKIPNSQRQSILNENAENAMEKIPEEVHKTIPNSTLIKTAFGFERQESPVSGTPLDQTLKLNPESFQLHLDAVFDWLERFQIATVGKTITKKPQKVEDELTNEIFGLTSTPAVNKSLDIPLVASHGDLYGSNIYLSNNSVKYVIDWEWARLKSNPMIDAGFFILQLAAKIGHDFEDGFEKLIVEENAYNNQLINRVSKYCRTVGISPLVFITYLPIGYLSRAEVDMCINKRLDIDWPGRIKTIWNYWEDLLGIRQKVQKCQ